MMIILVAVASCTVEDIENIDSVEDVENIDLAVDDERPSCIDLSDVRKVVEPTKTTYQFLNNECNTLKRASFRPDDTLSEAIKIIDVFQGVNVYVKITYSYDGFYYRDTTVGRGRNTGTQALDYDYVNGDNFITVTYLPSHYVTYIYDGDTQFDSILNGAHHDVVVREIRDVVIPATME